LNHNPLFNRLTDIEAVEIKKSVIMAPNTSYRIGGPAGIWIVPRSEKAVGQVLQVLHRARVPLFVLGLGTNILVSDKGWDGAVVHIGPNLSGWYFEGSQADVLAGTGLMDLIKATVGCGLAGMESMAGIPGSVGGGLQMNAGAFGQEIASTTVWVRGFYPDGTPFNTDRDAIGFGYRTASQLQDVVITSARFRFTIEDPEKLTARMEKVLSRRRARQPLNVPSCGSVFKRPRNHYAGKLIAMAGLKGERIGGAMVSPKHAGFIVNTGSASATDVFNMIRKVERTIWHKSGVRLEREVKLIGDFGPAGSG
jgi:UDP-N-acetylmuramate dehydrogenase